MDITFRTNLDMAKSFVPYNMGEYWAQLTIPPIGTIIEFPFPSGNQILQLEVRRITYQVDLDGRPTSASVELHIPSYDKRSIMEWEQWMNHRLGRV